MNIITHLVFKHVEDSTVSAGLLFVDFSSAFNTLQSYLLIQKMKLQGMHFLRRLRVHSVNQRLMNLFYKPVLESLIQYGIQAWYVNLSEQLKSRLVRFVQTALKVMGKKDHQSFQSIYKQSVLRGAQTILAGLSHILHSKYEL